jgi:sugar phosphate isomerase/epimerase
MAPTRRAFLAACAAAVPSLASRSRTVRGDVPGPKQPLGVVIHSYTIRAAASQTQTKTEAQAQSRGDAAAERFGDAFGFLDYCHALGARGVQVAIGARDEAACERLRARAAAYAMDLEGTVRLPRDRDDLDRFRAEVLTAVRAGAAVLRTTMFTGRRYETFPSAAAFRRAGDAAIAALTLAEPVVAGHGVRLAVENHKDWRTDELIAILKRIDSAHVGVCVDTGNSIALLEDPYEVVEALAPLAFTCHLKDMAVQEYDRGFLLSEVPLGTGFLDIRRIVRTLRAARPEIHLNLEMITRDPLEIPCLTENYWATFEDLPGRHLARSLTMVRTHAARQPLPRISGLTLEEKLKVEDENVRRCFAYARESLVP